MKLLGLLVTMVVLGVLVWLAYGKKDAASATSVQAASSATLGAAPPSDVSRNLPAAREHVQRQTCLAECASEERTCAGLAVEPSATQACAQAKAACDTRCP